MAPQSYSSHAHRPTLTGVGYLFVVVAIVAFVMRWLLIGGRVTMAIGLIGLIGGEIALLMISRNYITRLQDRIIRLEMRVRTASLLTPDQQRLLDKVRIKQLVALRFASDVESRRCSTARCANIPPDRNQEGDQDLGARLRSHREPRASPDGMSPHVHVRLRPGTAHRRVRRLAQPIAV